MIVVTEATSLAQGPHHVRVPDPQALRSRLTGDAGPVRVTLCSENGDPLQGLRLGSAKPG